MTLAEEITEILAKELPMNYDGSNPENWHILHEIAQAIAERLTVDEEKIIEEMEKIEMAAFPYNKTYPKKFMYHECMAIAHALSHSQIIKVRGI
jgi:hypothetical protein